MNGIILVAGLTFRQAIRHKAVHVVLALALGLFLANLVITSSFTWEVGKVAVDVGLSTVSLSGLLLIFFLGVGNLAADLERRSVYMVLSRPVTRSQFLVGTFVGMCLVLLAAAGILALCAVLSFKFSVMGKEAWVPMGFSWSLFGLALAMQILALFVLLALGILLVCLTSQQFTALFLLFLAYVIGQSLETVQKAALARTALGENPVLTWVVKVAGWIFPNFSAFDYKLAAAYGLPQDPVQMAWVAAYGLAYIGFSLWLAVWAFSRRELS
ncbi:MAG: ABC transporter permease [Deltaproteobacteria bacterium]|nr:ABC transporter permease [Deltaproteobacteria bacterium]